MFRKLNDTILKLNADVSDLTNQEKAKRLRKRLLIAGGICAGIGIIGIVVCFIAFNVNGFSSGFSNEDMESAMIKTFIPFCLIIPFSITAIIGGMLIRLGLSILLAGATTKFVDKSLNRRCECGNTLEADEKFCPKCGKPAVKTCPNCNTENDLDDEYCSNCGQKL